MVTTLAKAVLLLLVSTVLVSTRPASVRMMFLSIFSIFFLRRRSRS
jgi:hypothetical protein